MHRIILGIVLFLTGFSIVSTQVEATSWVALEPQEVVTKAQVVVLGKYDFSSTPIPGEQSMFEGLKFEVIKVYHGENIPSTITAGINGFDNGWVDEFQQQGGEMLLFLEKGDPSFLTPVGGPNGMIQMKNGQVEHPLEKIRTFYQDYLKEEPKETAQEEIISTNQIPMEEERAFPLQIVLLVIFAVSIILFGFIRFRKSK